MEKYYDQASLFLNTSSVEGFPNTFLQSWSLGTPVMSAGVDPSSIIKKYELGEVVQVKNNPEEEIMQLAARIKAILSDQELWAKYAQNAKIYINEFHSQEKLNNLLYNTLEV
jgi:glycosyltransferase involved in cell wall biosynthesis